MEVFKFLLTDFEVAFQAGVAERMWCQWENEVHLTKVGQFGGKHFCSNTILTNTHGH